MVNRYLVNRFAQALITLAAVTSLAFVLIRMIPGGPADAMRNRLRQQNPQMSQAQIDNLVSQYANYQPNAPLWQQYLEYLQQIMTGSFGISFRYKEPVLEIFANAMPWTVFVMASAIFLGFGISVSLGALMAYYEGGKFDLGMTAYSITLSSIPYYVTAILALYFLAFQMGIFPTGGHYSSDVTPGFNTDFMISVSYHAALPIASMFFGSGLASLGMRGNAIRVLGEDYMRVARLRGLSDRRIALRYVLHNAVLPMYTGFMISIGTLFGGSVILEEIFAYPGMGYFLLRGFMARDYPLMMGGFILLTTVTIIGILIADLTYGLIDPRAGAASEGRESYIENPLRFFKPSYLRSVFESEDRYELDSSVVNDRVSDNVLPFNIVSDTQLTARERFKQQFDEKALTSFRIIWDDMRARVGTAIVLVYLLMGTVGVLLMAPPRIGEHPRLVGPFQDMAYPLGTTQMGQDLFAQIVHATPPMLKMVLAGAVFSVTVGTVVGIVAGYTGGNVDRVISTITDIAMTIPGLPLIIILTSYFPVGNPYFVGLLLSINGWAGLARGIRSQVLTLREESYVEASRAYGASVPSILREDLLPNLMPFALVTFVQSARGIIFASVGLYFIGVLPFSTRNWGVILNQAYTNGAALQSPEAAHWFIVPMVSIIGFSFGLILLSQSTDRLFNPRVRARHEKTTPDDGVADSELPGSPMVSHD